MNIESTHVNGTHAIKGKHAMNGHSNRWTEHVRQATDNYCKKNAKSQAIADEACKYFPGGSTRVSLQMTPFTLTFASGQGSTLTSVDGQTYDDFLGEYTAGIYGHSHTAILKAIQDALSQGWNLGGHSTYEARLAAAVCERFQPTMERVRFTNSGTEANTFAVGTALAHFASKEPARRRIMVFDGGYHGGTFKFPRGSHSSTDPLNLPHQFVVAPFDDEAGVRALLEDPALDCARTLAAMLIEPMQGNAGARPAQVEFLRFLRSQCDRLGAFLIFDEVQTSRLGPHGLGEKVGVRPDLMTLGKWVGGGMTFGAFGGRAALMEQYGRGGTLGHAGTFNNNVPSMAAGVAGLALLTPQIMADLNARGDKLKADLQRVVDETLQGLDEKPPLKIAGVGSILSLQFEGRDADDLRGLCWHHLLRSGIYLAPRGFIALSIEVTDAQCQRFIEALRQWLVWYREEMQR